jgi:photosystem II stability/assembly factor-like uncharacterized protein
MRGLAISLIAAVLTGCVAANTAMLDDRTAIISARGSAYNTTADVMKKVVLEAAKKARANGYEYFQIVGTTDAGTAGVIMRHGATQSNVSGRATCSSYSCYGSASGTSSTAPSTFSTYIAPGSDVTIRFLRASEVKPDAPGVFRTAAVLAAK